MGTVVVIGGGTAGASAARALRRQLGPEHRITLFEKEAAVLNQAVYPLLAVGRKERRHLSANSANLKRRGVEVVLEQVVRIDHRDRRIYTEKRETAYDLAIVCTGAGLNLENPAGAIEAGFNVHSLEGAEGVRVRLGHFQEGEIAILVASTNIKCPSSPYEYAFLVEDWFRRRGRSRDVSIAVYTPEPAPLSYYGKRVSDAASELLLKRSIQVHPSCRVQRVDAINKKIELAHGVFPFDLLLYCPEAVPPPLIKESGLGGEDGWLPVDRHTLAAEQESIFGMGDVTRVITPSGEALPKMGAVAHLQSLVAAGNAARLLKKQKMRRTFSGFSW